MLAVALLTLVFVGLVFPFPFKGRLAGDLFDLAHALVFCFALICLVGFCDPVTVGLPNRFATILKMSGGRIAITAGILATIGLVGEYLQQFSDRSSNWGDVAANMAGLATAVIWIASRTAKGVRRWSLAAAAIGLLVLVSVNPVLEIWDYVQQSYSFPRLASFERSRELSSWGPGKSKLERSREWSTDGEYSLKVTYASGRFPRVTMLWLNHDWSNCKALKMDLRNPGDQPLTVYVKIYDEQHTLTGFEGPDRFRRKVVIPPDSAVAVEIDLADVESAPATRKMDMRRIWAFEIFTLDVTEPKVLFIDDVRLTESGIQ